MVDVVGLEDGPRQLHHRVVFFVRRLRRREEHEGIGTVAIRDAFEPVCDEIERFVPSGGRECAVLPDEGRGETVGMVDEVEGVPAFHAQLPKADGMLGARFDAAYFTRVVCDEVELATGAAVWARGERSVHSAPFRPLTSSSRKTGPSMQQYLCSMVQCPHFPTPQRM